MNKSKIVLLVVTLAVTVPAVAQPPADRTPKKTVSVDYYYPPRVFVPAFMWCLRCWCL